MKFLAWIDGRVVEAAELCHDKPYILQRIHTLAGRAYNVARHIEVLREDSEALFGFTSLYDAATVESVIAELLCRSCVTPLFSCPVDMCLDCRGELSLSVSKPTFGQGAYLRTVRYAAGLLESNVPEQLSQTSVTVAMDAMADLRVRMYGADKALITDANGVLLSRPWQPVFVVVRGVVYTPREYHSVEYMVAQDAIRRAGYEILVAEITAVALECVDEVFMVDIMGISSISNIGHHRLLFMASKRIADCMMPKMQ